jgi:aminoglycoside phosphotransferase
LNFEIVSSIVAERLSEKTISAERFPTGFQHFVFDVKTETGKKIVVRIARPEHRHLLESAVFWSDLLKPKGVPLPEILATEFSTGHPFLILERLPGKDLGEVYGQLSKSQKKILAGEMVRLQTIAATLPKAESFGYLDSYESVSGCRTWLEVVLKYLDRSRERIKRAGLFDPEIVDRVEKAARNYEGYFLMIEPVAFFDDITTKNVIVEDGKLSGIVDVDWMCFGDKLVNIALTQMALLADDRALDYIEFWCSAMKLDAYRKRVLNLYSAMSCVDFMSEIGQTFNKDVPLRADARKIERFFAILENLLAAV